jgi:hypothetical protein
MVHVSKLVQFRYFSGIGLKMRYLRLRWLMLLAQELEALLRKSARIILIRLIQSESTIAFGAWLAYQFALHKQSK